ncbi:MAG: FecR domain-containing protein [Treponema sp.]|jgi:hypothetical protein|nr:FecR domain-containing protein [Treponema sp.]
MKKVFFTVLMVSAVVFTVYPQFGIIRELSGNVELKTAGSSVFVPAQQGSHVAQDTIVSTGFRSTAIIDVGSSVITVRPLTRLSLSEIQSSSGTENLNVNLQAGRIRVDVKPPAGTRAATTIQSSSSTASARRTTFEMDIFDLDVIEGRVVFNGKDGITVITGGGSSSIITSTGSAKNPNVLTQENMTPPSPVRTLNFY